MNGHAAVSFLLPAALFRRLQAEGAVLLPHGPKRAAAVDPHLPAGGRPPHRRRLVPGGGDRGRAGSYNISRSVTLR